MNALSSSDAYLLFRFDSSALFCKATAIMECLLGEWMEKNLNAKIGALETCLKFERVGSSEVKKRWGAFGISRKATVTYIILFFSKSVHTVIIRVFPKARGPDKICLRTYHLSFHGCHIG
jgi:hypothetical protein